MTKEVTIDGVNVALKCSAVTYIKYRALFHEDLFTGLQKVGAQIQDGEALPDGAVEILLKATYIMALQGNPKERRSFEEWLDQFSLKGSLDGIGEVYDILLGDEETIEDPKKKNDRQSGE